jgi:hypothetical protein
MMNELRILSKIQDLKREWSNYEEDNLLNEYSVDDDYRSYNAHVNIYKAKIDILMEILQND